MTVDIYGHLIPGSNQGAVNQLDPTQPSAPCTNKKAAILTITACYLWVVPKAGLEPARVSPLPPQDSVSTCSTTSAHVGIEYYSLGNSWLSPDCSIGCDVSGGVVPSGAGAGITGCSIGGLLSCIMDSEAR
jgi:hypothetical protein